MGTLKCLDIQISKKVAGYFLEQPLISDAYHTLKCCLVSLCPTLPHSPTPPPKNRPSINGVVVLSTQHSEN